LYIDYQVPTTSEDMQKGLSSTQFKQILRWKRANKREPELVCPKTFTDKQIYRWLYYKDPYYYSYATKINAPLFIKSRLPKHPRLRERLLARVRGLKLTPLKMVNRFGAYQRITPKILRNLPADAFMIKSNWGSGLNCPVVDRKKADLKQICRMFNARLSLMRNTHGHCNHYNSIIIEELIGQPGKLLEDFKFHCIRDKNQNLLMIMQHYQQVDKGKRVQSAYDVHFKKLDFSISTMKAYSYPIEKPRLFDSAVDIAHRLSAGFDYIRLDLYIVDDGVYFGEFTPYHSGGCSTVTSRIDDLRLGQHWNMRRHSFQPDEQVGRLIT
jgi:hypothetical protein